MKIAVDYPDSPKGTIDLIGNPLKMSRTPPTYRRPPPRMGQHSDEVLREAGLSAAEIAALRAKGAV
jgi:crotonobetainyl-CoA:carnitine CoA-transferase CaiB-like acyl-CoA transferase